MWRFVRFNDVRFSPTCLLSCLIFPNYLEWREHSPIQKYLEEKLQAKCNYGPASWASMASAATLRWEWTVGGFWGGAWHTLGWWQHLAENGLWFGARHILDPKSYKKQLNWCNKLAWVEERRSAVPNLFFAPQTALKLWYSLKILCHTQT